MTVQPIATFIDATGQARMRLSNGHTIPMHGGAGGGTEGPQGPQGEQGPPGPPGATGPAGSGATGAVVAGSGLSGGGNVTPSTTLNVGRAWGVTVAADTVGANQAELDARYALKAHTQTPQSAGFRLGRTAAGTIAAGDTKTLSIPHGLGKTPTIAMVCCYNDGGTALSGVASVNTVSSTNIGVKVRNLNSSQSEALDVSWLVA